MDKPSGQKISIHAPHTGRDLGSIYRCIHVVHFNPRAPYGARRYGLRSSAPSMPDFNPRAPYGARLTEILLPEVTAKISIHAPHTGRDYRRIRFCRCTLSIISIHAPHTGRDAEWNGHQHQPVPISIHAPHTGRDFRYLATFDDIPESISIHAPHTGRDGKKGSGKSTLLTFQSTRPIRGATIPAPASIFVSCISIHAPHTGRDCIQACKRDGCDHFNPRAPYGARLGGDSDIADCVFISIHAPHTGRDSKATHPLPLRAISIHAPHTGRDVTQLPRAFLCDAISIHAPHTGRDFAGHAAVILGNIFQSTRPIRGATAKMHNLCSAFLQQQTIKA